MFGSQLIVALSGLAASVKAQQAQDSAPPVWAVVAFVNNGEMGPYGVSLTQEGAQQMQRIGTAFRNRYLTQSGTASNSTSRVGPAPIQGISTDRIDNTEVKVMTGSTDALVSGATAFMQGLYPPSTSGNGSSSFSYVENAKIDYPLNGYQYAQILSYDSSESQSVSIQGDQACQAYQDEIQWNLTQSPEVSGRANVTQGFYSQLFSNGPFQGTDGVFMEANYLYATEIYNFVKYNYQYNETVYKGLQDANDTLDILQANAFSLEHSKTSYDANPNKNDTRNILYTIAGRTMASKVTDLFSSYVSGDSGNRKMTLMFGSFRPMMAFFSAAGLLTEENLISGAFSRLPEPGAAIVFEVVGDKQSSVDGSGLDVRFYYRPSADEGDDFASYALFGSGFDGAVMPYASFNQRMNDIGKDVSDWCDLCDPLMQSLFCSMSTNNSSYPGYYSCSDSFSPAVAGVIGAILMAVIIACAAALVMGFGGWRFYRRRRQGGEPGTTGFKGGERKASDADMVVSPTGHREERVGSWELRHSENDVLPNSTGAGIVTSEFSHRSERMDGDDVSVTGAPVRVRESI